MGTRNDRKRQDDCPIRSRNLPIRRDDAWKAKNDHRRKAGKRHGERKPEPFQDPGYFEEKVGSLHFLFGGAPRDVVGKHVCKEGDAQVDAQTSKEEEATIKGQLWQAQ